MTIAVCGKWCLYDGQFGGIPMYNRGIARGYVEQGHEALLICPKWNPALPDESAPAPGIRILRVRLPHIPSRAMRGRFGGLARFAESWLLSREVRRALDSLIASGSVQAAEFAESSLEGYHSMGRLGIPHFLRCHTPLGLLKSFYGPSEFGYGRAALGMEAALIRRAPLLTTPSEDLRRQIVTLFGVPEGRVSVVPNPVEPDVYRPPQHSDDGRPPTVLHVGRLDSRKGGTVLGEAAPAILRQVPEARIVFAGQDRPGPEGEGVAASILRACPPDAAARLVFAGEVDEARLVELYAESRVCVVPSMIYESFSYTAAQAMSCARPVAASRIGGIPEVVADGVTGRLVPPGDAGALAAAVVRLLGDPAGARAMGQAGRERVLARFTPAIAARTNLSMLGLEGAAP